MQVGQRHLVMAHHHLEATAHSWVVRRCLVVRRRRDRPDTLARRRSLDTEEIGMEASPTEERRLMAAGEIICTWSIH